MKKKSRKKRNTLSGTSSSAQGRKNRFSVENVKSEGLPILLVAAGLVAANALGKFVDDTIKTDNKAIKKIIKPVIVAGTGLAMKILLEKKELKDIGTGVAISGILTGLKEWTADTKLAPFLSGEFDGLNPDLPEFPDMAGYLESAIDGDLADIDGEIEDVDAEEVAGDDDLDGDFDDDDDLSGRKRGGRKGKRRRALPPAEETLTETEAVNFV
jgi:hypothetical protein